MPVTTNSFFKNSYTFTIDGMPAQFSAQQAAITADGVAAINYLANYISWKGTLDFVVKFQPATSQYAYGLLPAYGGRDGGTGQTYAGAEAMTGVDANGGDYDLGCFIYPNASTGQLTNYGVPLFFDPSPDPLSSASIPADRHDFFSIFLHESMHGHGFWSTGQWGAAGTKFDSLTVQRGSQWFFTGANTRALLGQDLPLDTIGSRDHYGTLAGDPYGDRSPFTGGLMFQSGSYEQNRWQIGKLDLAVLKDLGYTVANEASLNLVDIDDRLANDSLTWNGDDQDNRFYSSTKRDIFLGNGGTDTADMIASRAESTVTFGPNGVTVSSAQDNIDTFIGMERVEFSDGTLAIDIGANAGQTYRLYQAAFDRVPDTAGLAHNIRLMDAGYTLKDMAGAFIASAEFIQRYGTAQSDTAYINALYQNVLHRDADAGGLSGWLGRLADGSWNRTTILIGFSESPENINGTSAAIAGGIWLG